MTNAITHGVCLSFYCHARAKHHGTLVCEWLLGQAKDMKLGGGSVFRAVSGFGKSGVMHEEQFFDLTDDLPVKIEFLLERSQADALVERARSAGVDAIFAFAPVEFASLK